MDITAYRDEIKLSMTGYVTELELDDETLDKIINKSFREVQRFITDTYLITIPYSPCIDMSKIKDKNDNPIKISAVTSVFRAKGYISEAQGDNPLMIDPMQATQWQLLSGIGNMQGMSNYVLNYASWNTLLQIRNTTSTDLDFRYEPKDNQLYVNISSGAVDKITVEYIPRYDNVDEIISDYWIDIICKLAIAHTKIVLGRIRSKYSQSNALWGLDGDKILEEGNSELKELTEYLITNNNLSYGID